ncbi:p-loop containing nucleoside triphosphate hydrolase protein [Diaporthe amygdali]|uniref:p-loop containing nucleoside triphosphate hydrolase protein n=1 Tax=Phomopsis amygdali TaxID=1214568 RepID=UPI0022FE154C|nr:p-loop containing nucleoside triphosphate hydrolase protein [Diaporthe amygdali]KAJ0103884.1 p-loop containing nucleoside triphosphate hydrolase protein [Diaporthe amygdali]
MPSAVQTPRTEHLGPGQQTSCAKRTPAGLCFSTDHLALAKLIDIGNKEITVEQRLSKWFRLAKLWEAVVVIDKVDAFLERRSGGDLKRNSIVSVFTKFMENYRGFLFLTTNRVGAFDEGLVSRIHATIRYYTFTADIRRRMWQQMFQKLEAERRETIKISREAVRFVLDNQEMRDLEWNGREMRNAFQTAIAFAEYHFSRLESDEKEEHERPALEEEDFMRVAEAAKDFKSYLVELHHGDGLVDRKLEWR